MQERTIGVVLDSDFEHGVAVYEGVRSAVEKVPGWSLVPVTQSQQGLLRRLAVAGRLDGVIAPVISDRWVEELRLMVPAVVNISNISRIESVSSVVTDDYAVGELAARHFAEMGVRRAGVIYERSKYASLQRRAGFCDYLQRAGIPVEHSGFEGAYSYEGDWEHWLRSLKGEVAFFGTSDGVVRRFITLYRRLEEGLKVSAGAVAGVGDSLAERTLAEMDLSSVVLPAGRIGIEAVQVMQRLLDGELRVERLEIKPDELKVRLSSAVAGSSDSVVVRAQGYIERRLADHFTVDDVARFAGASRRKLEMRFKSGLGTAPAEYIRNKRMKLAERLLRESGLSVREVAARCGAGSLQAFTAQFKVKHGVPPGRYREIHF